MIFQPQPPTTTEGLEEWVSGPYTIAVLAFLFGQHRVQVWHTAPDAAYPEIVPPNW